MRHPDYLITATYSHTSTYQQFNKANIWYYLVFMFVLNSIFLHHWIVARRLDNIVCKTAPRVSFCSQGQLTLCACALQKTTTTNQTWAALVSTVYFSSCYTKARVWSSSCPSPSTFTSTTEQGETGRMFGGGRKNRPETSLLLACIYKHVTESLVLVERSSVWRQPAVMDCAVPDSEVAPKHQRGMLRWRFRDAIRLPGRPISGRYNRRTHAGGGSRCRVEVRRAAGKHEHVNGSLLGHVEVCFLWHYMFRVV